MDEIQKDIETYYKQIENSLDTGEYLTYNKDTWDGMYALYNSQRYQIAEQQQQQRQEEAAYRRRQDAVYNRALGAGALDNIFTAIDTSTYIYNGTSTVRSDEPATDNELISRIAELEKKIANLEKRSELVKEQNEPEHRKIST